VFDPNPTHRNTGREKEGKKDRQTDRKGRNDNHPPPLMIPKRLQMFETGNLRAAKRRKEKKDDS